MAKKQVDESIIDSDLKNIMDSGKELLEENKKMLDKISNDIKAIENFLREGVVYINYKYMINDIEYIKWDCDTKRIVYPFLVYGIDYPKPLHEQKACIRICASKHFAMFLKEVLKNFKEQRNG